MFRRFSVNFAVLSILIDAILVSLSLFIAVELRPLLNIFPFTRNLTPPLQIPFLLYPLFSISWISLLLLFSVYDGRKNIKLSDEFTSLTLGSILATVALAGTLYLSYRDVSRVLFLAFVTLSYLALISWRLGARLIFRFRNGANELRRVLIVGAGPVGRELEAKITLYPHLGLDMVGFVDDNPDKKFNNADILGTLQHTRDIVTEFNIHDVVIALPRRAHEEVNRLVAELHNLPVKVWVIPDYFHLALHKATIEEFAGIPMLDLRAPALNDYERMIKRAFDLIVSIITLPIILILMAIISIAIRLEGKGPVFFRQKRVGENGAIFNMLKFRTMVPDAEKLRFVVETTDEHGNFIHKKADDPRVTKVGRILRRTSLDEIPQILNIIKGEMSLVGPRPEIPYLVEKYEPWQHKRFAVPQGLTGWWQVNGRSEHPMHLHTEDDIYYVQNYSLFLDIQILVKTIWAVLRRKGAY